jgi:hypothetical protein
MIYAIEIISVALFISTMFHEEWSNIKVMQQQFERL